MIWFASHCKTSDYALGSTAQAGAGVLAVMGRRPRGRAARLVAISRVVASSRRAGAIGSSGVTAQLGLSLAMAPGVRLPLGRLREWMHASEAAPTAWPAAQP